MALSAKIVSLNTNYGIMELKTNEHILLIWIIFTLGWLIMGIIGDKSFLMLSIGSMYGFFFAKIK